MHKEARCQSKTRRRSLTDQILTLCMSGRFGVQEAIAKAIKLSAKKKRALTSGEPVNR